MPLFPAIHDYRNTARCKALTKKLIIEEKRRALWIKLHLGNQPRRHKSGPFAHDKRIFSQALHGCRKVQRLQRCAGKRTVSNAAQRRGPFQARKQRAARKRLRANILKRSRQLNRHKIRLARECTRCDGPGARIKSVLLCAAVQKLRENQTLFRILIQALLVINKKMHATGRYAHFGKKLLAAVFASDQPRRAAKTPA